MEKYIIDKSNSDIDTSLLRSYCTDSIQNVQHLNYKKLTTKGQLAYDGAISALQGLNFCVQERRFFDCDKNVELNRNA